MSTPSKDGWSAEAYNRNASFVYSNAYTVAVLSLLNAEPGDRIMDFGCGSGELTLQIERIATQREGGVVVGVDGSANMVHSLCFVIFCVFRLTLVLYRSSEHIQTDYKKRSSLTSKT